ncbi:MAG: hypothetical protein GEU79_15410 [Acidimicrobiia bacterium]|nr:hypothetical protein [Acidimicrobiia bacterium]
MAAKMTTPVKRLITTVLLVTLVAVPTVSAGGQVPESPELTIEPRRIDSGSPITASATFPEFLCPQGTDVTARVSHIDGIVPHFGLESDFELRFDSPGDIPQIGDGGRFQSTLDIPRDAPAGRYQANLECLVSDDAIFASTVVYFVVEGEYFDAFDDDDGHQFESALNAAFAWGLLPDCLESEGDQSSAIGLCRPFPNDPYGPGDGGDELACKPVRKRTICPDAPMKRWEAVEMLYGALFIWFDDQAGMESFPYPRYPQGFPSDSLTDGFAEMINRGLLYGCGPGDACASDPAIRKQVASLLVRTFDLTTDDQTDHFEDDENSIHEADINTLASLGIVRGCAPNEFCPDRTASRGETAVMLTRILEIDNPNKLPTPPG